MVILGHSCSNGQEKLAEAQRELPWSLCLNLKLGQALQPLSPHISISFSPEKRSAALRPFVGEVLWCCGRWSGSVVQWCCGVGNTGSLVRYGRGKKVFRDRYIKRNTTTWAAQLPSVPS